MKTIITNSIKTLVKNIISLFVTFNGSSFVGLTYTNKDGETSNHVINVGFSYGNAVKKDLLKLQTADINNIAAAIDYPIALVETTINKMIDGFIKNQNKETQSNQSKAQQDAYIKIEGIEGIKIHKKTQQIYVYAMSISKEILTKGTYTERNSNEITLCQNAIKKYLNLSTAKYRKFVINANQFHRITANKLETILV